MAKFLIDNENDNLEVHEWIKNIPIEVTYLGEEEYAVVEIE
jgi:hypothetical protein